MRQKEEFQKRTNKNFLSQRKMKIIFSQREETLIFTKQFTQVERVRNISWVNFQKVEKVRTGDEKGEMND